MYMSYRLPDTPHRIGRGYHHIEEEEGGAFTMRFRGGHFQNGALPRGSDGADLLSGLRQIAANCVASTAYRCCCSTESAKVLRPEQRSKHTPTSSALAGSIFPPAASRPRDPTNREQAHLAAAKIWATPAAARRRLSRQVRHGGWTPTQENSPPLTPQKSAWSVSSQRRRLD